jgi:hypothetical protein
MAWFRSKMQLSTAMSLAVQTAPPTLARLDRKAEPEMLTPVPRLVMAPPVATMERLELVEEFLSNLQPETDAPEPRSMKIAPPSTAPTPPRTRLSSKTQLVKAAEPLPPTETAPPRPFWTIFPRKEQPANEGLPPRTTATPPERAKQVSKRHPVKRGLAFWMRTPPPALLKPEASRADPPRTMKPSTIAVASESLHRRTW